MTVFNPRPGQFDVVNYKRGKMGVSAVPGSGKTQTLSFLAAKLITSEEFFEDQEILIVTLVNSAVDNFTSRVAGFLKEFGLIPGIGYRVRTLHGLSYDIVREHPDLIGLDNHFSIADERISHEILSKSVHYWLRANKEFMKSYSSPNIAPEKKQRDWDEMILALCTSFIKQAKDFQISIHDLSMRLMNDPQEDILLNLGVDIYADYERALSTRGLVDFEDLIRFAYQILINNPDYLGRLRMRWPVILEDEAQDSSLIQEKLLRLLCGETGNWVRVGDPNQAIYETFTTADPQLLRDFISQPEVVRSDLNYSGRSTKSIIDLANYLIQWSKESHPLPEIRGSLDEPFIRPTMKDDPQRNPLDQPDQIHFSPKPYKPDEEVKEIAKSLEKWLPLNPDSTVAVLVPRNERGTELVEELERRKIPFIEHLKSTKPTRDAAKNLADILLFFVKPSSVSCLTGAVEAVLVARKFLPQYKNDCNVVHKWIKKSIRPEALFQDGPFLLQENQELQLDQQFLGGYLFALEEIARWQGSVALPIDQIIMTIAMDLFTEPYDLALAHKLAVVLKSASSLNPDWELPDSHNELESIAKNRFRMLGFSEDDLGFDPDQHKGQVIVSTIHKAKGLEWDRVYLMSVNNYDFPSCQENDSFISEKWFIRDQINLEAEAIARLKAVYTDDEISFHQPEGVATSNARVSYCAERLRLLYVGITRARKQLVITWNTGRRGDCVEALPLREIRQWWEGQHAHS